MMRLLLSCLWVVVVGGSGERCASEGVAVLAHLGSRTPYEAVHRRNQRLEDFSLGECEAQRVWMLVRHGARTPSQKVLDGVRQLLPPLRHSIALAHDQGKGSLCRGEVRRLLQWTPPDASVQPKRLVAEGEAELQRLGKRLRAKLPQLFSPADAHASFQVLHTNTQRTQQSALHLVRGLFGAAAAQNVSFKTSSQRHDPLLRFYKHCSRWVEHVDDLPEGGLRERIAFLRGAEFAEVLSSVAARVGLPQISQEQLEMMWQACAFESAWHVEAAAWCVVFSQRDLQVLEFGADLKYYWNDGHGFEENHAQACRLSQHMVRHLTAHAHNRDEYGAVLVSHSGALLKLLAHLGLYKEQRPLVAASPAAAPRHWRVSQIDSFAANLVAVLLRCGEGEERVLLMHQERPVAVEGCARASPFLCPLQALQPFDACDFERACALDTRTTTTFTPTTTPGNKLEL